MSDHAPLTDEELALPDVQPDRAWAEHLGMPRIVADLRAAQAENVALRQLLDAAKADAAYWRNLGLEGTE